jgi:hypothetical protein
MYLAPPDFDVESLAHGEAVAIDWSEAEYFADRRTMSRSDILSCKDDPENFHAVRSGKKAPSGRTSKSMTLGTLVHIRLLEPERWAKDLAPPRAHLPGWIGTQAAWTRHRKITIENNPGAIDATDAMVSTVEDIAARVEQHRFASSFLGLEGPTELTIVWREPTTGVLCRVRLDKLGFLPDGGIAVPDLKTGRAVSPAAFSKVMLERRYHVQAALYSDAVRALFPGREVIYAIIAVRNVATHKVGAWPVAPRAIDFGRSVYMEGLQDYKRRMADGDWLEAWERDYTHEMDLPEWHYRRETT